MYGYVVYVYILLWDDIGGFMQNCDISSALYSLFQL